MKKTLLMVAVCGVIGVLQTQARADWTYAAGYYWECYNGKYYALTETGNGATWDEVRQEALDLGGDLVTIDDAAENSWLAATIFSSPDYQYLPGPGGMEHLWIGLCQPNSADPDIDRTAGWEWVDGSELTWSNWAANQPSDGAGEITEDWAAIKADGNWNDYSPFGWLPVYDGIQGIMESDEIPSAPVPGAALLTAVGSVCVGWLRRRHTR